MDLSLTPEMTGIQAIQAIRTEFADARIIVLSAYKGDEDIFRALQAGAVTYLLKETLGDDLIPIIREVHAGGGPIPPEVGRKLADRVTQAAPGEHGPQPAGVVLQQQLLGFAFLAEQVDVARAVPLIAGRGPCRSGLKVPWSRCTAAGSGLRPLRPFTPDIGSRSRKSSFFDNTLVVLPCGYGRCTYRGSAQPAFTSTSLASSQ